MHHTMFILFVYLNDLCASKVHSRRAYVSSASRLTGLRQRALISSTAHKQAGLIKKMPVNVFSAKINANLVQISGLKT